MSFGQTSITNNIKTSLNRFSETGAISMSNIRSKYFPGSSGPIRISDLNSKTYYTTSGTGKNLESIENIIVSITGTRFNLSILRGKFYSFPDTSLTCIYSYADYKRPNVSVSDILAGVSGFRRINFPPTGGLRPVSFRVKAIGGGGGGGAGGTGQNCGNYTNWSGGGGGGGGGSGGVVDLEIPYSELIRVIDVQIGSGSDGLEYGNPRLYVSGAQDTLVYLKTIFGTLKYFLLAGGGYDGDLGNNGYCQYSGNGGNGGKGGNGISTNYTVIPHSEDAEAGRIDYEESNKGTKGKPGISGSNGSTGGGGGEGGSISSEYYAGRGGNGSNGTPMYGGVPARGSDGNPGCLIIIYYYV